MSRNYLSATASYEFVSPLRPEDIAADLQRFTVRRRDDVADYGNVSYFTGTVDASGFTIAPIPIRRQQSVSLAIIGRLALIQTGSRVTVEMRPSVLFFCLRMAIIIVVLTELSRAMLAFSARDLMIAVCAALLTAALDLTLWQQIGWQRQRLKDHFQASDPEPVSAPNRPTRA